MIDPQTAASSSDFRVTPQLILGLLIVFVGLIFTLDQIGYSPAISYLRYWPMAIIAIGLAKISYARDGGGAFAGLVFIIVGIWLQGEELGLIDIKLRDVWPLALVLFGGYLVWQGLTKPAAARVNPPSPIDALPPNEPSFGGSSWGPSAPATPLADSGAATGTAGKRVTDTNSTMSAMAILGAVSRGNNSRNFRGADLLAIMGGCEIDLRQAAINGEAVIDVFAMWGGIEVRVPEDWTVVSRVVPLMGGVDDKTRPPQGATAHRLVLRGFAIMGGIEIKN